MHVVESPEKIPDIDKLDCQCPVVFPRGVPHRETLVLQVIKCGNYLGPGAGSLTFQCGLLTCVKVLAPVLRMCQSRNLIHDTWLKRFIFTFEVFIFNYWFSEANLLTAKSALLHSLSIGHIYFFPKLVLS